MNEEIRIDGNDPEWERMCWENAECNNAFVPLNNVAIFWAKLGISSGSTATAIILESNPASLHPSKSPAVVPQDPQGI